MKPLFTEIEIGKIFIKERGHECTFLHSSLWLSSSSIPDFSSFSFQEFFLNQRLYDLRDHFRWLKLKGKLETFHHVKLSFDQMNNDVLAILTLLCYRSIYFLASDWPIQLTRSHHLLRAHEVLDLISIQETWFFIWAFVFSPLDGVSNSVISNDLARKISEIYCVVHTFVTRWRRMGFLQSNPSRRLVDNISHFTRFVHSGGSIKASNRITNRRTSFLTAVLATEFCTHGMFGASFTSLLAENRFLSFEWEAHLKFCQQGDLKAVDGLFEKVIATFLR